MAQVRYLFLWTCVSEIFIIKNLSFFWRSNTYIFHKYLMKINNEWSFRKNLILLSILLSQSYVGELDVAIPLIIHKPTFYIHTYIGHLPKVCTLFLNKFSKIILRAYVLIVRKWITFSLKNRSYLWKINLFSF